TDYFGMLLRRYLNPAADLVYTQQDQDTIVADLRTRATTGQAPAAGTPSFAPGSFLPLDVVRVNADGSARAALSGQLRDRTYTGGSVVGSLISDLSAVINGFDFDIQPAADVDGIDHLRVWYPSRGVSRNDLALVYGSTVSALTRSVASSE